MNRKKIGILGGTFDPIHLGHVQLAKTAYEQFHLDEMWIMPNGNPPHKKNQVQTDFLLRCQMVELAIADTAYMELCDVERSAEGYHYTYQTLEYFHGKHPQYQFYFIIGADSLMDFTSWREPGKITKLATLLVACRDDSGQEELKQEIRHLKSLYGGEFLILNSPKVDAASNEIRRKSANGEDISGYLDGRVLDFIQKNHLYEKQRFTNGGI